MKLISALILLVVFSFSLAAQTNEAPTFAALAMDNSKIDTAALRGKVVVLNLWFINCMNCVEEIRLLNDLVDDHRDNKDIVFIGLAASTKPELEKFLAKNPFKYTIIPNAQMIILSKFGTPDKNGEINVPFPMHYVIDRDGRIVVKEQGIKGVEKVKSELVKQFSAKTATDE